MSDSSTPPGPIEPTKTGTLPSGDVSLYTETFLPPGEPKGVALITHGFFEHCGRYREVAHVIVKAGWAAMSYDVRGHGKSGGTRGFVERFERYVDDLGVVLAAAKQLAPGKPTVLVGHSHGGLITLRALCADRPPDVAHAIISSPYLGLNVKVPAWQRILAKVASRVVPTLKQSAPLAIDELTSDPQKQAERKADTVCFEFVTVRWFTEALAAHEYVFQHADRIRVPTTWYVAGADKIANPAAARRVAERTPKATYLELARQMHEVFNEVDRGKVFSQVTGVLAGVASA
jgi:alpha-beta hydrolase superfamily lysophospholipase